MLNMVQVAKVFKTGSKIDVLQKLLAGGWGEPVWLWKTNDRTNTFGRRRDKGDCGMYHHATADRLPATHVLYHHKKKFESGTIYSPPP